MLWRGQQTIWSRFQHHHLQELHKRYLEDPANDPVICDLRHQGQIYDKETGLYYNRHRYYDTDIGQYLSSDPIGMAGGLRPQAYVFNPVDWVDPLGLAGCPKKSANKIIDNAQKGKVRRGKDYHGRLEDNLEKDILSSPEGVYEAKNGNLVFHKEGNVVVTHGKGGAQDRARSQTFFEYLE